MGGEKGRGSSGVASSGAFKSTESRRRSSINDYFRRFKLREDKKVGGIQGMLSRERERRAIVAEVVIVCIFHSKPQRRGE